MSSRRNWASIVTLAVLGVVLTAGCLGGEQEAPSGAEAAGEKAAYYEELINGQILAALFKISEAFSAAKERDYPLARQRILEAGQELEKAREYHGEGMAHFTPEQAEALEVEIALTQIRTTLYLKFLGITEEAYEFKNQKERILAGEVEWERGISLLLPKMELISRGAKELAQDWREYADLLDEARTLYPELEISPEAAEAVRGDASFLEDLATYLDGEVANLQAELEGYVPVAEREIPVQPSPEALPEQVTPEIAEFFDTFDKDRNNKLSIGEAQDFFYWVENNIQYRYDNENELNPLVGFIVGDGRPGGDYRQTSLETLNEGYGDCEDMATLEAAFYRFYGIDAYVVGVNALKPGVLDHAAAIVWIADKVELFRNTLGDLVYYEIGEEARDIYGNPVKPGVYMLVDNSYSNAFGYLSGGLEPGTFRVHCIIPLERGYGEEWFEIPSACGVPMD